MLKCFRDNHGLLRAEFGDRGGVLGSFLEQDIQGSVASCKHFLELIAEMEQGRRKEWSGTGNAHTVTIRPDGVVIENAWDETLPVSRVSLQEFKECLSEWLKCVQG
jgi:uncharacterized protein YacL (UPF0231 family)